MKRLTTLLLLLLLVATPLALARPRPAAAATSTMTIVAKDRFSGGPAKGACYTVADVSGVPFGIGGGCDWDDGLNDGRTTVTTEDPCDSCNFHQNLPQHPAGVPSIYLPAPDQRGAWGDPVTFENARKPYLVVTSIDARTGERLPGVCVAVADVRNGGAAAAACDRDDTKLNGVMKTKRLGYAPHEYRVDQTLVPAGYVKGASVTVITAPSGVHQVTVRVPPKPRIVIKTRDAQTGFLVKGACYTVAYPTGGAVGKFCDANTGNSDPSDDANDGTTTTVQLTPGTYKLIQATAPAGYRKAPDREVTVAAGRDKVVTVKNAPG